MKFIISINYLFLFVFSSAFANETENNEIDILLKQVDVSHPYYNNDTYGKPKINLFKSANRIKYLAYQARHGGDGEHTPNMLHLFIFKNGKATKIVHQNIDSVEFVETNNALTFIKGRHIETLCTVCDGWEVSEKKDIFVVPMIINISTLKVKTDMSQKQKEMLRSRLEEQSQKNIKEQLSYGRKNYPKSVKVVKDRLFNFIK